MNYLGYDINVLKAPRPAKRQITRLDQGRFLIKYKSLPNFELELNFMPFQRIFELTPPYVLLHWQALPKGLRTWGLYCASSDSYYSFDYNQIPLIKKSHQLLQYDETLINVRPTAVLYYPDSCFINGAIV